MNKPKILITNDDGINSPGLKAAVKSVLQLGELTVVAPSTQRTVSGRSLSAAENERLREIEFKIENNNIRAFHCDCSPAFALQSGLDLLFNNSKPDLVISGINYGENLGINITNSGTVGAAMQAASWGIPSLAVSLQTEIKYHLEYGNLDWEAAEHFVSIFAEKLISKKMPFDVDLLKVDVPSTATVESDWKTTRLYRKPYFYTYYDAPSLKSKFNDAKLAFNVDKSGLDEDSDVHAVICGGVVSVTPISLDMTSRFDIKKFDKLLRC